MEKAEYFATFNFTMKAESRAYLEIHIAVFLWGFTAILGDLIALSALLIVFWRVFLTSISLYILWKLSRKMVNLATRQLIIFAGIGVLVGLHWITFYGAIKMSNASVALICFATTSFFTSLFEPFVVKSKFSLLDMGVGLFIIPGMIFIVNGLPSMYINGILVGLFSALLAAMFSTLNKKYIKKADPTFISMIEISSATLFLTLIIPVVLVLGDGDLVLIPQRSIDWFYLALLAFGCTTLPYILSMRVLHHLSAFATNLVINLEPVYGIILAIIILREHEEMSKGFYIGSSIIVASVLFYPLLKRRLNKT